MRSDDGMSMPAEVAVVIVTGGSLSIGRAVARELAGRGYAVVVVYLDDQNAAEATVEEVLAAGGTVVAVRADLTDELDVERLFAEAIATFGGVDAVVETTARGGALLLENALRHLSCGGAILSVASAEQSTPEVAQRLRERDIMVHRVPPGADRAVPELLAVLDGWRGRSGA